MSEQPAPPDLATETAVESEFDGMEVDAPRVGIVMGSKSDMPAMEKAAKELEERGIRHEVRVMSAHSQLPVIGVPLTSSMSVGGGLDALLSIAQMPPGVPVACVGVDNARNAAVLAARILDC
jgi:phosphoribosylcarboxyaminoimidazole (NCAIR) mutase